MVMTNNFEITEKDGGIRMIARGKTIEELFSNALLGTAFYLKPEVAQMKKTELKECQTIQVEAVDIVSLLVEFLSKVIEQSDMRGAVFSAVSLEKFGENFLEGKIFGAKAGELENPIREVSFDEIDIRKNPDTGFYETALVFEV